MFKIIGVKEGFAGMLILTSAEVVEVAILK
jgi:hypothetical protein